MYKTFESTIAGVCLFLWHFSVTFNRLEFVIVESNSINQMCVTLIPLCISGPLWHLAITSAMTHSTPVTPG